MSIQIRKPARKFIERQPLKAQNRIVQAIYALPEGDIQPLRGKNGIFRLRVGDYRITFRFEDSNTIIVHHAGNRGDIYK